MTQHELQVSGCEGKERFTSYQRAARVANRWSRKGRVAYHCTFCDGFHVGTRAKKPRKPEVIE